MSAKRRQTFGKLTRDRARQEKGERKPEKKDDRKRAVADAREAGLVEGTTDEARAVEDDQAATG